MIRTFSIAALLAIALTAQDTPPQKAPPKRPPKPGVTTPGVRREMSAIQPEAVFNVEGAPDWQVVTDNAVWVASEPRNTVHRLDPKTNTVAAVITVGSKPCSGLAAGFGSIWTPSCGDHTVVRVDATTNRVIATVPVGPADSEGGITASPEGVWLVTNPKGVLSRIDPATNQVASEVTVPPKSASCIYADGAVWVTTPEKNLLTRVDSKTNQVTATIEVGPQPRFLTAGAGSVWTLNQGDGSVTRVDAKTSKAIATIAVGVPGGGGEIAFGEGHIWATVFQIPLSEIDPATNQVIRQWFGPGGDSVRVGHGSIWLSNLREQTLWRLSPHQQ